MGRSTTETRKARVRKAMATTVRAYWRLDTAKRELVLAMAALEEKDGITELDGYDLDDDLLYSLGA